MLTNPSPNAGKCGVGQSNAAAWGSCCNLGFRHWASRIHHCTVSWPRDGVAALHAAIIAQGRGMEAFKARCVCAALQYFGSDAEGRLCTWHCKRMFVGLAQHSRVQLMGFCIEAHCVLGMLNTTRHAERNEHTYLPKLTWNNTIQSTNSSIKSSGSIFMSF